MLYILLVKILTQPIAPRIPQGGLGVSEFKMRHYIVLITYIIPVILFLASILFWRRHKPYCFPWF